MTEVADRIALSLARAWETNARACGGTVERIDGLLVALTEVADPQLNVAVVERAPDDPAAALATATEVFSDHGFRIGLDLPRARHPDVERAAADLRMIVGVSRPAMSAMVAELTPPVPPPGVEISRLDAEDDLRDMWQIQSTAFGMRPDVARAYLSAELLRTPGVTCLIAGLDGRPVASALAMEIDGSVGLFGVATLPDARGRGIGTAITAAAVDRVRDRCDLAWLQASEDGGRVYRRMGFSTVGDWDVWLRPPG
ncbi:MAG: GNAT family N-acetyltransferase [Actinomycetota bacterium]